MNKTVGILGGDARMGFLARMLSGDGYSVYTWDIASAPAAQPLEEASKAERIILPVPLTKKSGLLNSAQGVSLDTIWSLLRPEQHISAGAIRESEHAAARAHGLTLHDYYTRETLTVRNAVPTAEGAIQTALENMSVTLNGAPCLVVGFGRIGKLLAHDLKALGAQVSVSARRLEDLAWIDAFGYRPLRTNHLGGTLGGFRAIFNTVPHPVLAETQLRELRPDCVLIELASAPGIDAEAAKQLSLAYVKASGLPGRTAPESAAIALKETIYQLWEEET